MATAYRAFCLSSSAFHGSTPSLCTQRKEIPHGSLSGCYQAWTAGFFRKWHCGHQDPYNPVHHGFDEFVGLLNGAGDHHRHGSWSVGLRQTDVEGYSTDVITDRSVDFVE